MNKRKFIRKHQLSIEKKPSTNGVTIFGQWIVLAKDIALFIKSDPSKILGPSIS